jgi:hypothetical protein
MNHAKSLPHLAARLFLALIGAAIIPALASAGDAKKEGGLKGVTELGIERTPCDGSCPVYSAVFSADGTVRYEGKLHVEHVGVRTGKVPKEKFEALAAFVLDSGFITLEDSYFKPVRGLPSAVTTVVAGGVRKAVRDQKDAGPAKLVEVEGRIDALLAEVKWDTGAATRAATQTAATRPVADPVRQAMAEHRVVVGMTLAQAQEAARAQVIPAHEAGPGSHYRLIANADKPHYLWIYQLTVEGDKVTSVERTLVRAR